MTSSAYNPLRSSAPPEYKSYHENVALLRAELKATADERDMLLCEVERLRSCVDSGRQLSMSGSESHPVHSYDWLKAQCDAVMEELHMLQQQHSDMVCVCFITDYSFHSGFLLLCILACLFLFMFDVLCYSNTCIHQCCDTVGLATGRATCCRNPKTFLLGNPTSSLVIPDTYRLA